MHYVTSHWHQAFLIDTNEPYERNGRCPQLIFRRIGYLDVLETTLAYIINGAREARTKKKLASFPCSYRSFTYSNKDLAILDTTNDKIPHQAMPNSSRLW